MPATDHLGELAALGTAFCWSLTAVFFAAAGRRVGSLPVNLTRLVMALAMLAVLMAITRGQAWPTDASTHAWLWLAVSGFIGFTFGDLCLFRAFVILGPRLSSLIMSLAPPLTAVIGWLVLGEKLEALDLLGMALTVGGITWAVAERQHPATTHAAPTIGGVLLAVGGAVGQAAGLVLSKYGMGTYNAFAATQVRIIAGIVGFVIVFSAAGWWRRLGPLMRDRKALGFTAAGALFGPFLGVSLSLVAVQHTLTGVAASIMATAPIVVIPIVVIVHREKVGLGGVLGAIVAVSGVALLFR